MADRYTFFIPGTAINQFHPIYTNCQIKKEKIDVKERITIEGTLKFGGQYKEAEYDVLKTLIDDGKLPIVIKEDGVDISDTLNLILDGDWDDDKKTVELGIENIDLYTPYFENKDTEIPTNTTDWNIMVSSEVDPYFEFSWIVKPDDNGWTAFNPGSAGYGRMVYNGLVDTGSAVGVAVIDGVTYLPWETDNPNLETLVEYFGHWENPDKNNYMLTMDTYASGYWVLKSNVNFVKRKLFYSGGRSLINVLNDLYIGDISDQIDVTELSIDNYYVFPSGSLLKDNDDKKSITIEILNELMETLMHVYVRITKPVSTIISIFKLIKNITYNTNGYDLGVFAKNHNKFTVNNLEKPSKIEYETTGSGDFASQTVGFTKASSNNEIEIITISNWVSDVQDALVNTDDYKGKFFIIKANTSTSPSDLIDTISNYDADPIDTLNGSAWTTTTLKTFTWNGEGKASGYFKEVQKGTILRVEVDSPFNVGAGFLKITLIVSGVDVHEFTNLQTGSLYEDYIVEVTNNYTLRFELDGGGSVNIDNIRISEFTREIVYDIGALSLDSKLNGAMSLANLLDTHIAEMPYDTANFNASRNIDVHKKRDKLNIPIKIKSSDQFITKIPFDEGVIKNSEVLIPVNHTRNMNGNFDEFNGYIK